jgi:hypothetical protein
MEFEHPIFVSPEEYKEYHQIMNELAEEAERNTLHPQPKDLGLENNSFFNQKNIDSPRVRA